MRRLSGFDAMFIYTEHPRETHHTLKVCILGEEASAAYDFKDTKAGVRALFPRLPLLRWRLLRIPLDIHHPVWIENENIDLDYHVRRLRLPDGAGRKELCRAISEIASEPLDYARPLWETWWLEGYESDKVVAVLKVSHALADGGSFVDLFERALFAKPADAAAIREFNSVVADSGPPVVERPGRAKLILLGVSGLMRDIFVRAPRLGTRALQAHRQRREERDLPPRPTMAEAPHHVWEGPLSSRRTFYFTTVPLPSAKQIAKATDATVNDVVLAVSAGAVRSYLQQRDALPERPILANMTASMRRPEERGTWGNRVTTRLLRIPTHLADPLERLRYAQTEALEAKRDIELRSGAQMAEWIELTPPFIIKPLYRLMRYAIRRKPPGGALIVSNVRGPASTLYTLHGPVENIISVGNIMVAVALNITVWSYVDNLNFGLYTDEQAFPDISEVAEHIDRAFAELADAAATARGGNPSQRRG